MIKTILTIAGSDCSGGAGIQADLKTIVAHNMYGMSAITALTAQNTTGVYGIEETSPVMVSTSGSKLLCDEGMNTLITKLLPLGTIITPNIPEAQALCGFEIANRNPKYPWNRMHPLLCHCLQPSCRKHPFQEH